MAIDADVDLDGLTIGAEIDALPGIRVVNVEEVETAFSEEGPET